MTELKCPFCGWEAYITEWESANSEVYCSHCDTTGDLKLWQALIDTRKALDGALKALNDIQFMDDGVQIVDVRSFAYHALEQINKIKEGKDD